MGTSVKTLFCLLLATLLIGIQPGALAQTAETAAGTARLSGKVTTAAGKAPASGTRVLAYHLSTETLYAADVKGNEYRLTELPYGYFDLAVELADGGIYVGNQVVNVPPAGKVSVSFSIVQAPGSPNRDFPGTEQASAGQVKIQERLRGRDFWRSPRGIAILAGGGGAVLLAIASGGGSDSTPASASTP